MPPLSPSSPVRTFSLRHDSLEGRNRADRLTAFRAARSVESRPASSLARPGQAALGLHVRF